VASASVTIDGRTVSAIGEGLLVYLGVGRDDDAGHAAYLAEKVAGLRVLPDEQDRMNRDVTQTEGQVLVVSAFTVQADARRGRRPTFDGAAPAESALGLYEAFCEALAARRVTVARGSFGAMMQVHSVNAGPVCILLDSSRQF
jgi:D-tyrosyl-tRNA(Tyr) deacylase